LCPRDPAAEADIPAGSPVTTLTGSQIASAVAASAEVSTTITGVKEGVSQTGAAASQVLSAADQLSGQAQTLRDEIERVLADVRAA
jgi:methyl-accepting chemotaxis protein